MKEFRKVIREINMALNGLRVFDALLTSALIFLIAYLGLSLLNQRKLYAALAAGAFFCISAFISLRKSKIREVERLYPALDEKLRTAADNIHVSNEVVEALQAEVKQGIRKVELARFFNERSVYLKALCIMLLCFMIIYTIPLTLETVGFPGLVENFTGITLPRQIGIMPRPGSQPYGSPADSAVLSRDSEGGAYTIYGEEKFAVPGNQQLLIKFKSVSQELNVREQDAGNPMGFEESYPADVAVTSGGAYEEKIPQDQQELVKRYFQKLAEDAIN